MYLNILESLSVESKGLSMGFPPMYSLPRFFPTVRAQNYFENTFRAGNHDIPSKLFVCIFYSFLFDSCLLLGFVLVIYYPWVFRYICYQIFWLVFHESVLIEVISEDIL